MVWLKKSTFTDKSNSLEWLDLFSAVDDDDIEETKRRRRALHCTLSSRDYYVL